MDRDSMEITVRTMEAGDWPIVKDIYEQGIATRLATFETEAPEWISWDESHLPAGRLVACNGDQVAGWAALSPVSDRCVYAGVAEVSIYIDEKARGQGLGATLLKALIVASETAGIWTLQAGMFPENQASLKLHKHCGFREVGYRERLGQLDGVWRDVILLERRSQTV